MSNQSTTAFQEHMVVAVEKLAVEVDANCECQLIRGKTENYYILSLVRDGVTLEVYVYVDEMGFFQGEDWNMYEKWDFDSREQLQRSVLSDLKDRLTVDSPMYGAVNGLYEPSRVAMSKTLISILIVMAILGVVLILFLFV